MKRNIFLIALVVCLVAVMACGSLAYFTANHEVTNTFKTASFDPEKPGDDPDPDDLFSVVVKETKNDGSTDTTTSGNTYKDILPGDTFKKDPTVYNTGEYDEWVRVTVTFSGVADWKKALKIDDEKKVFNTLVGTAGGYVPSLWQAAVKTNDPAVTPVISGEGKAKKITYQFYLKNPLLAGETGNSVNLFNKVAFSKDLEKENMAYLTNFTISVKADAIQKANTGDTVQDAFAIFDTL